MLKISIQREIIIDKSKEELIDYLADFRHWPAWSPWLIIEPDCTVEFEGLQGHPGCSYRWSGQMVGAGNMTLMEKTPDRLDIALVLQRPSRAKVRVAFKVQPQDQGCKVIWLTDIRLSWYLIFFKKMMLFSIGADYDRGLAMLKSQMETGNVHSHIERLGIRPEPRNYYVGVKNSAPLKELGELVEADFTLLHKLFKDKGFQSHSSPITFYQRVNMATSVCEVINAFPVEEPLTVEEPFICEPIGPLETYVVRHTGDTRFIGNGWAFAMMNARYENIRTTKQPIGMERYLNSPYEVEAKDLEAEVVLFCR